MDIPTIGLQAIFDQAAVGISQISLDGAWLLVNNRYCQMLGYSEAELRSKTLQDITHPDDFAEALTGRQQLLEGLIASHSMEKRYIRKDGTVFWGRLHRSLVRDHDNLPRFFVAMVEDITQKKQAENALRESEEALRMSRQRLELAQEAGGIATWDWDIEANETRCSKEYGRLYGLPTADFAPPPEQWCQLIHPEDRERVREELNRTLDGTAHYNTEFRVVWPDGTVHWLFGKGEVFRDSGGKAIRMLGVNMDISERKFAEQTLRESEERFRNMADTAPVMIWVSGPDKLCTFFNKPWLNFTGHAMGQELGNGWASGVHPDDLDRCLATYSSAFDARHNFQMEYRLRRADGEYRWVLDNGTPHYRDGEFAGFIGSCIDVTEQKLIADRLRGQTVQLKAAQRLAKLGSWERHLESDGIDWSDEAVRIFGVSNSLAPTLPGFLNHVHPKDQERVLQAADEVHSSISPVELSYRIVRPDGEVRFVRAIVEAIRDNRGTAVRTVGSIQDITEQVKAEQLLQESEERLKNAERLAHVGHWDCDVKTNRASWSEEVFRILGKPPDCALSYEAFLQAVIPQDQERVARWVSDCLTEKRGNSIEFQIAWPSGEVKTIACISEVSLGDEGSPARIFGTCQDITGRKQVEEMLRGLAGRLLTAQEDERRRISHELHDDLTQRLAALAMELGSLAAELPAVPKHLRKRLRGLQRGVVEAAETSRHVAYQLHPSELDDLGLVRALRAYCEDFGRGGIAVKFTSGSLPESVNCEVGSCLYKVTQESLRNVAKHAKTRRAWVTLEGMGDRVVLRVRDAGVGFSVESLGGGVGLGVVGMQERVRNVKGSFAICSRPEQGTVITVEVPLCGAKPPARR
jgi:PAS domain S-box-containing protein